MFDLQCRSANRSIAGLAAAVVAAITPACGSDETSVLVAPECDAIGWPLGVEPDPRLPIPEFEVECADGWGHGLATREPLATVALPDSLWVVEPHPAGGWLFNLILEFHADWLPWLAARGIDTSSYGLEGPSMPLVWIDGDGELGWTLPGYNVWGFTVVGEQVWALAGDLELERRSWLLAIDAATGELLDAREWDLDMGYNQIFAATDPAGGAWITAFANLDLDGHDQILIRATSLDALTVITTTRRHARSPFSPWVSVIPLADGGAAWTLDEGFEVLAADGSVRWQRPAGAPSAATDDSLLITGIAPTGVGAGQRLWLERASLADGASLWTREHQRWSVAEPQACDADGCALVDAGSGTGTAAGTVRADGGYVLRVQHAWPSAVCSRQPMVLAVSANGEAEWAHRVETCGMLGALAVREQGIELLGLTRFDGETDGSAWSRLLAP